MGVFLTGVTEKSKQEAQDMIGKVFTDWIVLSVPKNYSHHTNYRLKCRCMCGNFGYVSKSHLLRGYSQKCKACTKVYPKQIGLKFGTWNVVSFDKARRKILCICLCGKKKWISPCDIERRPSLRICSCSR